MSDIRFRCPSCHAKLIVDEDGRGMGIPCPKCSAPVTIPERDEESEPVSPRAAIPVAEGGESPATQQELSRVRKELEEQRVAAKKDRQQFEQELARNVGQAERERKRLETLLQKQKEETRSIQLLQEELKVSQVEAQRERERRGQLEKLAADEKTKLRAEIDAAREQDAERAREQSDARAELERAYRAKQESAASELGELRQCRKDLESERDGLRDELEAQSATRAREQEAGEKRERALTTERDELAKVLHEHEKNRESEQVQWQTEAKASAAEIGRLKASLASEIASACSSLKEQLAQVQAEADKARGERVSLEQTHTRELASWTAELARREEDSRTMSHQAEADRKAFEDEKSGLLAELKDFETRLEEEQTERKRARQALDDEKVSLRTDLERQHAAMVAQVRKEQESEKEKLTRDLEKTCREAEERSATLQKTADKHQAGLERERGERVEREKALKAESEKAIRDLEQNRLEAEKRSADLQKTADKHQAALERERGERVEREKALKAESEKAIQDLDQNRLEVEKRSAALQKSMDESREAIKRERRERTVREKEWEAERVKLMERLAGKEKEAEEEKRAQAQALATREEELTGRLETLRQELAAEKESAAQSDQSERERLAGEQAVELDAANAALAAQEEKFEQERLEFEERDREFIRVREDLQRQIESWEARAAQEREHRDQVLSDIQTSVRALNHQPPKTVHALAEEARTGGLPLVSAQKTISPGTEADSVTLEDSGPDSMEDPSEDGSDTGEYLVSPLPENDAHWKDPVIVMGWLCLMAGAVTLVLRMDWLYPAAACMGLAFLLGTISMTRRRSPLGAGLIVMSLAIPLLFFAGNRWGGFEGILATPLPEEEEAAAPPPDLSPPGPELPEASEASAATPTIPGATAVPAAGIGDSTVVDGVRIQLDAVRVSPIVIHDILGKTITPDQNYLVVEVTLENTHPSRLVYLKKAWEKARLVDNFDNSLYVIHQQRLGLDRIEGSLRSTTELEPGAVLKDRLVFEMPSSDAETFMVLSDPGFYAAESGGFPRTLSRDSLRFRFTRGEIVPPGGTSE